MSLPEFVFTVIVGERVTAAGDTLAAYWIVEVDFVNFPDFDSRGLDGAPFGVHQNALDPPQGWPAASQTFVLDWLRP